jgi:hypothetical protein
MEMSLNEHKLKVSGSANMITGLNKGESYDIVIKNAEARGAKEELNDDGTYDLVHSIKISEMSEVQLVDNHGKIVASKKKGSMSQRLRFSIFQRADELGEDREAFYNKEMSRIINEY